MDRLTLRRDKGVAGLTILLSLVVLLFIIGLIVTVFAILGDSLEDATDITVAGGDVTDFSLNTALTNETLNAYVNSTILALDDVSCSLYNLTNQTGDAVLIGDSNYTLGGTGSCYFTLVSGSAYNGSVLWNSSYSFSYSAATTASGVIENTTSSTSTVINWFDIFIVITAMVVLILLTVIIITAIRGSGLLGGGSGLGRTGGGKNIGSA